MVVFINHRFVLCLNIQPDFRASRNIRDNVICSRLCYVLLFFSQLDYVYSIYTNISKEFSLLFDIHVEIMFNKLYISCSISNSMNY